MSRFCIKCETENVDEASFCRKCGSEFIIEKHQSTIEQNEIPHDEKQGTSEENVYEEIEINTMQNNKAIQAFKILGLENSDLAIKVNQDIVKPLEKKDYLWWDAWPWLGISFSNVYMLDVFNGNEKWALILIGINTVLMIFVWMYNKYAFLIATILSLNPLLWIINGIYLKNRWCHPKVNKGNGCN